MHASWPHLYPLLSGAACCGAIAMMARHPSRYAIAGRQYYRFLFQPWKLVTFAIAATLRLLPDGPAVGRSLAELNLRGLTGATVIAVERPGQGVIYPGAHEPLLAGDVLVFTGTDDAVAAARHVLRGLVTPPPLVLPTNFHS